ncbi:ccdc113 [Symbiodinium pilosum]|uniref:Ccdc113 protein n=1 Tax=Symbiodinium pilosum TaxID=2952 RepID=A0A812MA04_SYMPI|nr:ccdc113 [Symbiodinium pilosum]
MASWPLAPSLADDPRHDGWPCGGEHKESATRANQHGHWTTCAQCALRLSYVTITNGKKPGAYRQSGPPRGLLLQAIGELRMTHDAKDMTEDIFNGKCMEIVGRSQQPAGSYRRHRRRHLRQPSLMARRNPKMSGKEKKIAEDTATVTDQTSHKLTTGLEEIERLQSRLEAQKSAIVEEMALHFNVDGDAEMRECGSRRTRTKRRKRRKWPGVFAL